MTCEYNSCKKNKSIINNYNRILVLGDLHADIEKTKDILFYFKLIDNNNKWIGGDTILVQLGDQIDGYGRGGNKDAYGEQEILDLFEKLHLEAEINGGGVYCIIGNHELMNIMGNFNYASKKDIEIDGGIEERKKKYSPGSCFAKRLACTRNVILKIKDILFVHGGIVPDVVRQNKEKTINIINNVMKKFFNNVIDKNEENVNKYLIQHKGVLWNRELGGKNVDCNKLQEMLNLLNSNHIIIGHSVQDIINSKCNKTVWRVDVGLSKALGNNKYQILEIKNINNKNHFKILQ